MTAGLLITTATASVSGWWILRLSRRMCKTGIDGGYEMNTEILENDEKIYLELTEDDLANAHRKYC